MCLTGGVTPHTTLQTALRLGHGWSQPFEADSQSQNHLLLHIFVQRINSKGGDTHLFGEPVEEHLCSDRVQLTLL